MDAITVEVEPRKVTGKAVKHLRKEGFVPAVIHDHGKDSIVVQVEYQAACKAYKDAGKHHPVRVSAGGHKYTALIRSVTFDPKYNSMTHLVFNAVKANEKVEATVPIRARYDEGNEASPAERASLIVLTNLESVAVKALPRDLPDVLEFDGEGLVEVGDHATVADLIVPEGVEIETPTDHAIATVYEPSALQAANEDAGGEAEPEEQAEVPADHESGATEGVQAEEN